MAYEKLGGPSGCWLTIKNTPQVSLPRQQVSRTRGPRASARHMHAHSMTK